VKGVPAGRKRSTSRIEYHGDGAAFNVKCHGMGVSPMLLKSAANSHFIP
jgi:hypothetical protein